ncbi:CHRD domain-containing protein [Gillisia marina]|uniref:CHRD domain-containing protein n=1 Tax=Gillisia marina TaxID=1167637 RepID=UPI001ED8DD8E|nr:CHRD domain-containing protein [Gillisia marina]
MKNIKLFSLLFMTTILFVNCSSDDDAMQEVIIEGPSATANTKSYNLASVSDPNISGTVTVTELTDNSIQLDLNLQNTASTGVYPAHVHFNTAAEGGDIAVSLEAIDGSSGKSSTNFTALDNGTAISYTEFLNFDGYVNVHLSADQLGTLVAQGDIGQNELTGDTKAYELESVAFDEINGNVTFSKRKNGEALAVVTLNNTTAGAMYPGHIHENTAAEGGDIAVSLNPVNGDTGVGKTNIAAFDDGTEFNFDAILNYDGYVNIHLSADELGTLVAQGDIGQNELTGDTKSYELGSVAFEDISGDVTFSKRKKWRSFSCSNPNEYNSRSYASWTHPYEYSCRRWRYCCYIKSCKW